MISSDFSSVSTAAAVCSSSCCPVSVSSIRRVVRTKGWPICSSSSLSALLTDGGVISSLRGGRDIALARNALKDAYLIIKRVIHSISLRHPRLIIKYRLNILKSMTA